MPTSTGRATGERSRAADLEAASLAGDGFDGVCMAGAAAAAVAARETMRLVCELLVDAPFEARIATQMKVWGEVIRKTGIKVE